MKNKILTYLLLINFGFLFIGVLFGSHIHHDNSNSISTCSNFIEINNLYLKKQCFKYGISEFAIDHLFEKGAVYTKASINKLFNKFKYNTFAFLYFSEKNNLFLDNIKKIKFKTTTIAAVDIFLLEIIFPRPPPFYS